MELGIQLSFAKTSEFRGGEHPPSLGMPLPSLSHLYSLDSDLAPHLVCSVTVNTIKTTYHGTMNLAEMTLSYWTVAEETITIRTV
jgi:hypothetical protein